MSNKKPFTSKLETVFQKNAMNYFSELGSKQLPKIGNVYMLDVFLSADNCIELHYHYNASELVYVISGEVEVGLLNKETNEWETYRLERGEAISIPQGWWHYVCALKNHTHFLAIFDTRQLETVFGSDILWKTPDRMLARIYCLDEKKVKEALEPIHETVVIGPPADCNRKWKDEEDIRESKTVEGIQVQVNMEEGEKKESKKENEGKGLTGASFTEKRNLSERSDYYQEEEVNKYYQLQTMLELEQQQMLQPYGYYGNIVPYEICQICLGYRY